MFDEKTPHLKLPLPVRGNQLMNDVGRIRESFAILDEGVATAMRGASDAERFAEEAHTTARQAKDAAGQAIAIAESKATADDVAAHNAQKAAHGATSEPAPGAIALRDGSANIAVGNPVMPDHAVHKGYVDKELTDAEAAMKAHVAEEIDAIDRVPEAPRDHKMYGRRNGAWREIPAPLEPRFVYGPVKELDVTNGLAANNGCANGINIASCLLPDGSVYALFRSLTGAAWQLLHFSVSDTEMVVHSRYTCAANPMGVNTLLGAYSSQSLVLRHGYLYFFYLASTQGAGVARIALGDTTFTWENAGYIDTVAPEFLSTGAVLPGGEGIVVLTQGQSNSYTDFRRFDFVNSPETPAPSFSKQTLLCRLAGEYVRAGCFAMLDDRLALNISQATVAVNTAMSQGVSRASLIDIAAPVMESFDNGTPRVGRVLARWDHVPAMNNAFSCIIPVSGREGLIVSSAAFSQPRHVTEFALDAPSGTYGESAGFRCAYREDLLIPAGVTGTNGHALYPTCHVPGVGIVFLSTHEGRCKSRLIPVGVAPGWEGE